MYLSFRRVYFSGSFLLWASGISLESAGSAFLLTTVQRFCSRLFTGHSFPGVWLTWCPSLANVCLVLKILFQISSDEKVLFFSAKGSGQSFGSFSSSTSSSHATTMTYIPFSIHPTTGHGVLAVFDLHSDCFSGQSLGLVSSNTEG